MPFAEQLGQRRIALNSAFDQADKLSRRPHNIRRLQIEMIDAIWDRSKDGRQAEQHYVRAQRQATLYQRLQTSRMQHRQNVHLEGKRGEAKAEHLSDPL